MVDAEGGQLGVVSTHEARRLCDEAGLDLVEVSPDAKPPVCRIMDYGKYKYENKKKAAASRKKQVIVVIKEIQVRPRTDVHDFETKMKHARRFLLEGDKVKVNLRFMGREMSHQEMGLEVINRAIDFVKDLAIVESQPKTEGKNMFTMLAPDPVKIKEYLKANPPKGQKEVLPELSKEDLSSSSHTEEHDED